MIGSDEAFNTLEFKNHFEIYSSLDASIKKLKKGFKTVSKNFIYSSLKSKRFTLSEFKKLT